MECWLGGYSTRPSATVSLCLLAIARLPRSPPALPLRLREKQFLLSRLSDLPLRALLIEPVIKEGPAQSDHSAPKLIRFSKRRRGRHRKYNLAPAAYNVGTRRSWGRPTLPALTSSQDLPQLSQTPDCIAQNLLVGPCAFTFSIPARWTHERG